MGKNDFTEVRSRGEHVMREVRIPPREEREKMAALERQKAEGVQIDFDDDIAGDNGDHQAGQEKTLPKFAQDLKKDFPQSELNPGDEGAASGPQVWDDDDDDDERDDPHEGDPLWEDPPVSADTLKKQGRPDTLPLDALSETISEPVRDWMRHIRIAALLPVMCALSAISVALGRGLKVLSNKTWTYPNIFALMGAETGSGKSLVFDESMRPLIELQAAMEEAFAKEQSRLKAKIGMAKAEISAKHSMLQQDIKKGEELTEAGKQALEDSLSELQEQIEDLEDRLAKPPCVWTSDFTSEALGVCLKNNDERVAVLSDEGGMALYNLLGRYNDGNVTDDMLLCKGFSVNSHAIDRIGRGRITLTNPWITLLLIVQPDILRMAYSNTRLLLGGFLARCFSADTQLQPQEETEDSAPHFDERIAENFNRFIKGLFAKYHQAEEPYKLKVEHAVRTKSRLFHNTIVRLIRGRLNDVRGFAIRWTEQTWKVAQLLHVGIHGTESENHVLSAQTFENATKIVRYFITVQLEVLKMMRIDAVEKTHTRLRELFERHDKAPIRTRELQKRHGLRKDLIIECVKTYQKIYGVEVVKPAKGGPEQMFIFLRKSKPKNFEA
jgi:hypothetical protein